MRDALNTARTRRYAIGGILTGKATRTAADRAAVATLVAAGSLTAIDATTFGLFDSPTSDDSVSIASGSNVLTSPNNPWTAADVGKAIDVQGAGVAGVTLRTMITGYTNAGSVALGTNASTTVAASSTSAGGLAVWGGLLTLTRNMPPRTNEAGTSESSATGTGVGEVDVRVAFGAKGDGVTDDTAAIAAAFAFVDRTHGGAVYFPPGNYLVSATLQLPQASVVYGAGAIASYLTFTNAGDGLHHAVAVNNPTPIRTAVRDLGLVCTNGANTGGGIVDVGGVQYEFQNVFVQGFRYGMILDQSELVDVFDCEFTQQLKACVWLVNGPDHTPAAQTVYTNGITLRRCQFNPGANAGVACVVDDGGGNHTIEDCNFANGDLGLRAAGAACLRVVNNAFEGTLSAPVIFDKTTWEAAAFVGASYGVVFEGNATNSTNPTYGVLFNALDGGVVQGNVHSGATTSAYGFAANAPVRGVRFANNRKLLTTAFRFGKPFFDATLTTALRRANDVQQAGCTYVTGTVAIGAATVTPQTMEGIGLGDYVYCVNDDGTNGELVQVTAVAATTFTATFASTKAANWRVSGQEPLYEEQGTWTPVLFGATTAGAPTYGTQQGSYVRRGKRVWVRGAISITAVGGMVGGLNISGLPYPAANVANQYGVGNIGIWQGITAAGYTQLGLLLDPANPTLLQLRKSGSGQSIAAVQNTDLVVTVFLFFDCEYETA